MSARRYKRTVHVLPQGADMDRFLFVAKSVYPERQTVGFSYDDAGVGELADKTAVLWDVEPLERQKMVEWYEDEYPGTRVRFEPPGIFVDVSVWQGEIDFSKLVLSGVTHLYIRATYGIHWIDSLLERNVEMARIHGLTFGLYHYWKNEQDPLSQAEFFKSASKDRGDLPPVLDVEQNYQIAPLNPAGLQVWLAEFNAPVIYTNVRGWDEQLAESQSWASDYRLWVAHWTDASEPILPRDWNEWWLWQYTRAPGKLYGAESDFIDLNRAAPLA